MVRLAALFVATTALVSNGVLALNLPVKPATSDIPIRGNERILISVPEAVINVQAKPGRTLRIHLSEGAAQDYSVHSSGNVIRISPREPIRRETFGKITPKKRLIEIQGPALSLEVHTFEGQIQLNKWSKEALLHVQKGRIVSRGGAGPLLVHSQTGEIQILDHQGRVHLDTYKSKVAIRNLNGELNIENFAGETLVDESEGALSISQGQGRTKVLASSGNLEFGVTKGSLNIQKFHGRIEGDSQEGSVSIGLADETEVDINSEKGKVTVLAPDTSGAYLNLTSSEGELTIPAGLKVKRSGDGKTFKGRLKGETQKGRVVVRSQEGSIVVR